jgi:hypothetical protein
LTNVGVDENDRSFEMVRDLEPESEADREAVIFSVEELVTNVMEDVPSRV